MFGIENYSSFVAAIIAFQLIPGPGTLTILNATARHGVRSGMDAALGTLAGDFLFMVAAALGLAAILAAHPAVLGSLQWLGITYLCWLGLKLLLKPAIEDEPKTAQLSRPRAYFRQAFAVCLTNPKAIMFFMAFFPLFLRAGSGPLTLIVMMVHVSLLSLLYQTLLVIVGHAVAVRLSRFRRVRGLAQRLVGLALIGFGVKLAVNRR
jgi:threonine/homoserine/homoserine lactone efflux protein